MQSSIQAPLFRWAGSKRKLIPVLREFWDSETHRRYVEPFAGSAALYFALAPKSGVISDSNVELIHCYKMVRDNPIDVAFSLSTLRKSKRLYYALRGAEPSSLAPVERACRFIYLNRYCFNGLYRTSLSGRFNVPMASGKTGELPDVSRLVEFSLALSKAILMTADFEDCVRRTLRPGDFVYLDPPFAVSNKRVFRQYNAQVFGMSDMERLSDLLNCIDASGASFLVSYADCPEARYLFRGWSIHRHTVQRNIAGFASKRRTDTEIAVSNMPNPKPKPRRIACV